MQFITVSLSGQSEEKSVFCQGSGSPADWRCQRIHSVQMVFYARLSGRFGVFNRLTFTNSENAFPFWQNVSPQIAKKAFQHRDNLFIIAPFR